MHFAVSQWLRYSDDGLGSLWKMRFPRKDLVTFKSSLVVVPPVDCHPIQLQGNRTLSWEVVGKWPIPPKSRSIIQKNQSHFGENGFYISFRGPRFSISISFFFLLAGQQLSIGRRWRRAQAKMTSPSQPLSSSSSSFFYIVLYSYVSGSENIQKSKIFYSFTFN